MAMFDIKLIAQYGAVCFIPASNFDTVSGAMTWQGQTLALLTQCDELPGYWGYFTIAGMPDPTLFATDPGLNSTDSGVPGSPVD